MADISNLFGQSSSFKKLRKALCMGKQYFTSPVWSSPLLSPTPLHQIRSTWRAQQIRVVVTGQGRQGNQKLTVCCLKSFILQSVLQSVLSKYVKTKGPKVIFQKLFIQTKKFTLTSVLPDVFSKIVILLYIGWLQVVGWPVGRGALGRHRLLSPPPTFLTPL